MSSWWKCGLRPNQRASTLSHRPSFPRGWSGDPRLRALSSRQGDRCCAPVSGSSQDPRLRHQPSLEVRQDHPHLLNKAFASDGMKPWRGGVRAARHGSAAGFSSEAPAGGGGQSCEGCEGQSIGRHALVVSFLKGARILHPPRPPSVPPWELEVVLKPLSYPTFEPLTSIDLKELSIKTARLLAFASAKHIGDLHTFSVDSDCIRFGPGDCSFTLRPRLGYVHKSLSTPSKCRLFLCLPCLLSHRPRWMRTLRLRCAPSGLWGFTSTVRPAFGNLTSYSCATVAVRKAGPFQNRGFPTELWTL